MTDVTLPKNLSEKAFVILLKLLLGAGPADAFRLTNDLGAAEEICQEAFFRAWAHLHQLDPSRSPLPWLFTVTRNLAVGRARHLASRPHEEPLGARVESSNYQQEKGYEGTFENRVVAEAMLAEAFSRLSPDNRQTLQAVFLRGQGIEAAAAELSVPPGTVKSRTYYRLRALRLLLEEMGYDREPLPAPS
jgi:RNA polymerase sigma-70 factor (ECF subfamily)